MTKEHAHVIMEMLTLHTFNLFNIPYFNYNATVTFRTLTHICRRFHDLDDIQVSLQKWRLYAGKFNLSTQDPYEKFYHVRRVILHPGYNATDLQDDVAIVITVDPIE